MPGKDAYDRKKKTAGRPVEPDTSVLRLGNRKPEDPARAARLAELKAQIENGTYRPDLEKVAERLLPDLLDPSR